MRHRETHDLQLPPRAVANESAFPYADRFAAARAFLAQRGIAEVRPLYGTRATPMRLGERLKQLRAPA